MASQYSLDDNGQEDENHGHHLPTLRDKVRAYATLMGGTPSQKGPAPMDIDQIGEKESEERRPENEDG